MPAIPRAAIPAIPALAAALLLALGPAPAAAQSTERCYGVARAGQNDGLGDAEAPGGAEVDFQGNAWTLVPAGTCLTIVLPAQADGTPRRGAYQPLGRDLP